MEHHPGRAPAIAGFDLSVAEVLGAAPDAFFALGADWRVLFLNPAAERLLERRAEDLVGKVVWDEFPEAADSPFFAHYARAIEEDVTVEFTAFYPPLQRWFAVHAVPQRLGLSIFFHDVTDLKEAEVRAARLAAIHASLRTVATAVAADGGQDLVFDLVCRQSAQLVEASAAALLRFVPAGFEVEAATGSSTLDLPPVGAVLEVLPDSEVATVRAGRSAVVTAGTGGRLGEFGLRSAVLVPVRSGGQVWGCLVVAWEHEHPGAAEVEGPLREHADLVAVAIGNAQARRDLARQAATDPLTGLANLRTLHAELDRRLDHGRPRGGALALALVDVDDFKHVNDGFGHEVGDAVLRAVADRLRAVCRDGDVPARIGGDEFALVLDGCDATTALAIAERVRLAMQDVRVEGGEDLPPVAVSVGISAWEPGLRREALQRQADDALYWAKLHGRDAAWAYNRELMQRDTRGPERAAALRRSGAVVDPVALDRDVRAAKAFWQAALDGLSKQIAVIDEDGRIIATNAAWRRFAEENGGDRVRTGVGTNYLAVCDAAAGDDPIAATVARGLREVLAGTRESLELDYPCHGPEEERWLTVRANRFGPASAPCVIVHHQDVTARRRAERESAFRAELLGLVAVPVFATDADRRLTYLNGAAEQLHGWTADEALGRRIDELPTVDPTSVDLDELDRVLRRSGSHQWEAVALHREGRRTPVAITGAQLRDEDGAPAGVIGAMFDLSERTAYERSLRATRDYLRTVTDSIADGLLVCDADGAVTYANDAGRTLLGTDPVGRPAGEVLAIADPDDGAADLLAPTPGRHAAEGTLRRDDGSTMSVEWTSAALVELGPVAGDAGPADGSAGTVVVFRDVTDRRLREERLAREADGLRWAKAVRQALAEERFELHAQPLVATATGEVIDHELLIRLRDADGALVPPGAFLPAAEEHGLIGEIDRWVAAQAVQHAARGRSVHFNLSARSVGDDGLLALLEQELDRSGADPRRLTVELTETALLEDRDRAAAFARHLQRLGCHVALDDFGAGYNSFARIKEVPADVIKIDRQFVTDLLHDPASESVVKAIVAFAADLGLRVVAEGVEDAATASRLHELDVPFAQGFHFGRPAPLVDD